MEDGFHISVFARHLYASVHVFLDLRVGFKIPVYQFFGFLTGNVHTLRQPEDGDAVDDAEVGCLGFAAHIGGYVINIHLIYFGGSGGMNVITAEEGINHILVLAQMCHDAQFDLRVVGREELASVIGDEGFADFLAVLVTNGYVLQVRIA